jgi:hypothetical protein
MFSSLGIRNGLYISSNAGQFDAGFGSVFRVYLKVFGCIA